MDTPLKQLRKSRKLTSQEVAAAIGIGQGHYSRIENGHIYSPEIAPRIVQFFNKRGFTELHILYPERYMKSAEQAA